MPVPVGPRGRGRNRSSKVTTTRGTQTRALKKTTKKGAYRPARKKNFQIRRAPFVETKRRVHADIAALNSAVDGTASLQYQNPIQGLSIPNNDAYTLLDLASYYRNSNGFKDFNCIGDSIYSKYLKMKMTVQFPEGTNMIVNPVKVYFITGWVTQPAGWTDETTPTDTGATASDLRTHISQQLQEYFDSKSDYLKFMEMQTSNIKIESWQSIKPNLNGAIAAVPAQIDVETDPTKPAKIRTVGAVPPINRSFTWKTMRKVHLTEGTATATGNDAPNPDTQNLYPNHNNWLPFAIIYNRDFARMRNANNEDVQMSVSWNDIHYYTDS